MPAENKLMGEMAASFLDFMTAFPAVESPSVLQPASLKACCCLCQALEKQSSQCSYLMEHRDGGATWFEAGITASKRFSTNFAEHAEEALAAFMKEQGAQEAEKLLNIPDTILPARLEQCKAVLVQVDVLEKLNAEEALPSIEAGPEDFYSKLSAKARKLFTLWSLDATLLKKFVPDILETCKTFEDGVMPVIQKVMQDIKHKCSQVAELVSKFRRAAFSLGCVVSECLCPGVPRTCIPESGHRAVL